MAKHCGATKTIDGSIGPSPIHNKYEIKGVYVSNVCPKPSITALSEQFLHLYIHYKNHIFPYSEWGTGIYEQPNPYMQAMEIIESHVNN